MSSLTKYNRWLLLSIPIISMLLHWHVFNLDLIGIHVWRQTETQTTINNFFRDDMNILNPRYNEHPETDRLHRMEFPVMQWLYALGYKVFGYHIIISRVLTFILGLLSVYGIYTLLYRVSGRKQLAVTGAWCFNFSPVFYYYTVNPMPDNMALCCGIWSIASFCAWLQQPKWKHVLTSGIFLCLATMCKLPFIIYGSFMAVALIAAIVSQKITLKTFATVSGVLLLCLVPAAMWYAWVIPGWVIGAVRGITDQSLNHPPLAKVISGTLISVLPELIINYASVLFFICGIYLVFARKLYRKPLFLPLASTGIVCIVYFLFEMNIIDLVHDYYLFPFLLPIFTLVAYGAIFLMSSGKYGRYLATCCLLLLPLTAFLRIDTRWDTEQPGFNPAYLKYKDELRTITPPDALCVVGYDESHYILLYYIDRKGWAFDETWFDVHVLEDFISKDAGYIFLDKNIDQLPGIKEHLGEKLFDKEDLRVYKLR